MNASSAKRSFEAPGRNLAPAETSHQWAVALTTLAVAFLLVWPSLFGVPLINDDLYYSLFLKRGDFGDALAALWHTRLFRPIDLVGALLTDTSSLDARYSLLLHIPPLVGLALLARRIIDHLGVAEPRLVLWLSLCLSLLSASLNSTAWQPDLISQMWSGWLGLAMTLECWECTNRILSGNRPAPARFLICAALGFFGPMTKETFFGWSVSCGLILAWGLFRKKGTRRDLILLGVLTIGIPLLHFFLRLSLGGLSIFFTLPEEATYHFNTGANLIKNVALAVIGLLSPGPNHYAALPYPLFLRAVPVFTIALSGLLLGRFFYQRRMESRLGEPIPLWYFVIAAGASISAVAPTPRISEVYLSGLTPLACALIVAGALGMAGQRVSASGLSPPRAILGVLMVIAVWGTASRAYHFEITWRGSRALHERILHARESSTRENPMVIGLDPALSDGLSYSQYISPYSRALCMRDLAMLLNLSSSNKPVRYPKRRDVASDVPPTLLLTPDGLPVRGMW